MVWFLPKRNGGTVWCSTDLSEHPTVVGNDGKIGTKYFGGLNKP